MEYGRTLKPGDKALLDWEEDRYTAMYSDGIRRLKGTVVTISRDNMGMGWYIDHRLPGRLYQVWFLYDRFKPVPPPSQSGMGPTWGFSAPAPSRRSSSDGSGETASISARGAERRGSMDEAFLNEMLCPVSYAAVREAMGNHPFRMVLADNDEVEAVRTAVNQGIDSHLEACFLKDRDSYEIEGRRMRCSITSESLPVLLRRLSEDRSAAGIALLGQILFSLGFDDGGRFVGREALGLE
jgi:hypothetical protein